MLWDDLWELNHSQGNLWESVHLSFPCIPLKVKFMHSIIGHAEEHLPTNHLVQLLTWITNSFAIILPSYWFFSWSLFYFLMRCNIWSEIKSRSSHVTTQWWTGAAELPEVDWASAVLRGWGRGGDHAFLLASKVVFPGLLELVSPAGTYYL